MHSHRSRASGFVWKPGLIVTADEALADEGEVSVKLADGTTLPATIAGRDHTTDVALLRIDASDKIVPVALSSAVPDLGSLSVVVAAEHGTPTAALGAVSLVGGRWRSMRGGEIDARIELDVRLRAQPRGRARAQCLGRSHRHGGSGRAAYSGHSRRDHRPGRGHGLKAMAGSPAAISALVCSRSSSTMASE